MNPLTRKLLFAAGGNVSTDYMYVDASNPTFQTRWGSGNDATTHRTILAPHHKRVIIDGTSPTTNNGNYYHVANFAAAQALAFSPGDWWLLPGGQTTTGLLGQLKDNGNVGFHGVSTADMAVLGTFDPADKENDAKYNTLVHTVDATGTGLDSQPLYCYSAVAPAYYFSVQNIKFKATSAERGCNVFFGLQPGYHDALFENCDFDHVFYRHQGKEWASGTMTSQLTTDTFNNVTMKLCRFRYANGYYGGHDGNMYSHMARGLRLERCLNYHNGWDSTMNRSTPAWQGRGGSKSVTSITSSGTTATVTTSTPHGWSNGWGVEIANASPGAFNVYAEITVTSPTTFTYQFAGNSNNPATGTITAYSLTDVTGWTWAAGSGPDFFKHGCYITDQNDGTEFMDCVFGWDSSWNKMTGGNIYEQNCVYVRSAAPFFSAAQGNTTACWPSGSTMRSQNLLQIESCDVNNCTGGTLAGGGPEFLSAMINGSYLKNAILMNQSGGNKQGVVVDANGSSVATAALIDSCVFANWCPQDTSTLTNTTKTYTNNIWDEASSGSNTSWSSLPSATQAKRTALLAKNMYATFPTAYGISVSQSGTNQDIELRVLDYLADHWTDRDWCAAIQNHFRAALA